MKYLIGFLWVVILLQGCQGRVNNLPDGLYMATSKVEMLDSKCDKDFDADMYDHYVMLDDKQSGLLLDLLNRKSFHVPADLGTCYINGCFIRVVNKKVIDMVYLTCNDVQLQHWTEEGFKDSILLNDEGISQMDSLIADCTKKN